jgi:hypothetical protein
MDEATTFAEKENKLFNKRDNYYEKNLHKNRCFYFFYTFIATKFTTS